MSPHLGLEKVSAICGRRRRCPGQFGLRVQSQGGKGILKTIPRTAEAFAKNVSNIKIGIDDDDSSPMPIECHYTDGTNSSLL